MPPSNWSRRALVRSVATAIATGRVATRAGASEEPYFYIKSIEPEELRVDLGETVDITTTVLNIGTAGTGPVEYRVDDATIQSREITLDQAEERTLTFEGVDTESIGSGAFTHGIYTGDTSVTASLVIRGTAFFEIADLSPRLGDATPGGEFTVSVTITNTGDATGHQTVRVLVDGEEQASDVVALSRNESREVSLSVPAPPEEGEYAYTVKTDDEQVEGAVSVVSQAEEDGGFDSELLVAVGGGALTLYGAYVFLNRRDSGEASPTERLGRSQSDSRGRGQNSASDSAADPSPSEASDDTEPTVVGTVIDDHLDEATTEVSEAEAFREEDRYDDALAACERARQAAVDAREAARHYAPARLAEIETCIDEIDSLEGTLKREAG